MAGARSNIGLKSGRYLFEAEKGSLEVTFSLLLEDVLNIWFAHTPLSLREAES